MLEPLYGRIRKRRFIVYDMEWIPGSNPERALREGYSPNELRLIGTYDGKRYRAYRTVKEFLNGELTRRNRDAWFYAHSGGRHDVQFIFDYLINHGPKDIVTTAMFTANAASIVRVQHGRDKWHLLDSFFLIRQSLREIGSWVGLDKGGAADSLDIYFAPWNELCEYNERDCVILWEAIRVFQETINNLGGQLRFTLASTAMDLFRRRYLTERIKPSSVVNQFSRKAYTASRVEVIRKHVKNANYYDINSSFPNAMTMPCPGHFGAYVKRLPDSGIYLADATITVKECHLPPLPYRTDSHRIYFPTGTWRGNYSNVDLELLQDTGHKIETVHNVLTFEPFSNLRDYAQDIYEMRRNAKSDAEKVVLKFLLNSLYGKFAESEVKQQYVINPPPRFFEDNPERRETGSPGWVRVRENVYALEERREIPHAHVPIAAHITALAREALYRPMMECEAYYCDTDGFAVDSQYKLDVSDRLGGLKLEKFILEAYFEAPKLYAYKSASGACGTTSCKESGDHWHIKAKGFPRVRGMRQQDGGWKVEPDEEERPLTIDDFRDIVCHGQVLIERWMGVRQVIRSKSTSPRNAPIFKTYHGRVTPKRAFNMAGDSRPWSVAELEDMDA